MRMIPIRAEINFKTFYKYIHKTAISYFSKRYENVSLELELFYIRASEKKS